MTDKPETPPKRKPRQPSKGSEADPAQYGRFVEAARELGCEKTGKVVPDDPEQYQRFVEAAQELGADSPEAGAVFEQALRRVLSHRAPDRPASKRESSRQPKRERRRGKTSK